jgi:hypothetical protein
MAQTSSPIDSNLFVVIVFPNGDIDVDFSYQHELTDALGQPLLNAVFSPDCHSAWTVSRKSAQNVSVQPVATFGRWTAIAVVVNPNLGLRTRGDRLLPGVL